MTYRLRLNLRIESNDPNNRHSGSAGGLEINDHIDVAADTFMEIAMILGRFHELSEALKAEHAERDRILYGTTVV